MLKEKFQQKTKYDYELVCETALTRTRGLRLTLEKKILTKIKKGNIAIIK